MRFQIVALSMVGDGVFQTENAITVKNVDTLWELKHHRRPLNLQPDVSFIEILQFCWQHLHHRASPMYASSLKTISELYLISVDGRRIRHQEV